MKILFLGYANSPLLTFLREQGCLVSHTDRKLPMDNIELLSHTMLISCGYRHILQPSILEYFKDRAFNLHISLLPWNRGAHPNFWSLFDGTPSGVTIHHIDEGIDTGPVAFQKSVQLNWDCETLRTSHAKLLSILEDLFREKWRFFKMNSIPQEPQRNRGTLHRKKDIDTLFPMLSNGWDSSAREVIDLGRHYREREEGQADE